MTHSRSVVAVGVDGVVVGAVVVVALVVVGARVQEEEAVRVLVPGALVRVAAEEAVWQAVEALLVRASTVPTSAISRIVPREAVGANWVRIAPTSRAGKLGISGTGCRRTRARIARKRVRAT